MWLRNLKTQCVRALAVQVWRPECDSSTHVRNWAWLHVPVTSALGAEVKQILAGQPSQNGELPGQWETWSQSTEMETGGGRHLMSCSVLHVHPDIHRACSTQTNSTDTPNDAAVVLSVVGHSWMWHTWDLLSEGNREVGQKEEGVSPRLFCPTRCFVLWFRLYNFSGPGSYSAFLLLHSL